MIRKISILFLFGMLTSNVQASGIPGIERTGDYVQLLIPLTALGISSVKKDWEGAKQLGKGYFTTLAITYGLRAAFKRKRPYQAGDDGNQSENWEGGGNGAASSFPSGHMASAVSGAAYLQHRYGWKYGAPALAASVFVGWERVNVDQHYWSDILVGGAIAWFTADYFTDRYKNTHVNAFASHDGGGMQLTLKWK